MKTIPPTLRDKHRYIRFRIHSGKQFEFGKVVKTVENASTQLLGDKGAAEADYWIIKNKFDHEKQEGVIKVRREHENNLRAALTLKKDINGSKGFFEVDKVSGSIKNL